MPLDQEINGESTVNDSSIGCNDYNLLPDDHLWTLKRRQQNRQQNAKSDNADPKVQAVSILLLFEFILCSNTYFLEKEVENQVEPSCISSLPFWGNYTHTCYLQYPQVGRCSWKSMV